MIFGILDAQLSSESLTILFFLCVCVCVLGGEISHLVMSDSL